jgi:hypothetical protein
MVVNTHVILVLMHGPVPCDYVYKVPPHI